MRSSARLLFWFVSATTAIGCGTTIDLTRLSAEWSAEDYVLLLLFPNDAPTPSEIRVLSPGESLELELPPSATTRIMAMSHDAEVGSALARCGAAPESGQGLDIPEPKATWTAILETREDASVATPRFERSADPSLALEYAEDECYPVDLAGRWEGLARVRSFNFAMRMTMVDRGTYNTAVVDIQPPALLPPDFAACVGRFTVTATRTGGVFDGRLDTTCPGPCSSGVIGGSVTETEIVGMFQYTEGPCAHLAAGTMELSR